MKKGKFSDKFLFGAATSAHQIEGNNTNSDWWYWEQKGGGTEPSGIACDSYNKYEEDVELIKDLNLGAYRFSIEWARIEPTEGNFSQEALDHYKKQLLLLKKNDVKTFVTFHHFTSPKWLAEKGGWQNKEVVRLFSRYVEKCFSNFDELIDFAVTINEPTVYIGQSFLAGFWPPQKRNPISAYKTYKNMMSAHTAVYDMVKARGNTPVGIVHQITDHKPATDNIIDKKACDLINNIRTKLVFKDTKDKCDFLGLNYYFQYEMKNLRNTKNFKHGKSDVFEWPIAPDGLYRVLMRLKTYDKPIYITENGIADSKDQYREKYIKMYLAATQKAINDGVDVCGYFYWSLLDNFEWSEGYKPRFGLVEVDYANNQKRTTRNSAKEYAKIAKKRYNSCIHEDIINFD